MKNTLAAFILVLIPLFTGAQIDSLMQLYNATQDKEEKAILNATISGYYLEINADSSLLYGNNGLKLSEYLVFELGIAKNAAMLGDNYIRLDSLEKAKYYYSKAVDAFEKTEDYQVYSKVLMVLGNINFVTNDFPEALDAYQKSMTICEENGYNETLAHLHNNIGVIYTELGKLDKALISTQQAYDGFLKNNDELNAAKALISLAIVSKRLKDYEQALTYLEDALVIFEKLNDYENIAESNRIIGLVHQQLGHYEVALGHFNKALGIVTYPDFESLAPQSIILSTLFQNLAQTSYALNNLKEAEVYAEQSLELALANNYLKIISDNYLLLSEINANTAKVEEAYTFLKLHKTYNDSVVSENAIEKITQLRLEYEFDKKISEQELAQSIKDAEQQRQEYLYIISIVLVVFVAIIGFLLYHKQKNKTKQSKLEKLNLELESENLKQKLDLNQKELEYKNKELTTNIMYLTKKTGMITGIAKELQKAKFDFDGDNRDTIENVIKQLEETSGDDTWEEFELRFQDVHNEFYKNLNNAFPNLTPNEKKLCAFLKLNMSTKDISAITHQSVKSITMARYRLRQKLGIERDENLISYLATL